MLPERPELRTRLFHYQLTEQGGTTLIFTRLALDTIGHLPAVQVQELVLRDLRDTAESEWATEAQKALSYLFLGILLVEKVNNKMDICGHLVNVSIRPQVNDRWEENYTEAERNALLGLPKTKTKPLWRVDELSLFDCPIYDFGGCKNVAWMPDRDTVKLGYDHYRIWLPLHEKFNPDKAAEMLTAVLPGYTELVLLKRKGSIEQTMYAIQDQED